MTRKTLSTGQWCNRVRRANENQCNYDGGITRLGKGNIRGIISRTEFLWSVVSRAWQADLRRIKCAAGFFPDKGRRTARMMLVCQLRFRIFQIPQPFLNFRSAARVAISLTLTSSALCSKRRAIAGDVGLTIRVGALP